MSIAITASTGQLGTVIVEQLLGKVPAKEIVALARDPSKLSAFANRGITTRTFDYDSDQSTLQKALDGVRQLLLISSSEIRKRVAQHRAVIDAAKTAGVQNVIYTSILHADSSTIDLAQDHRETEAYLKQSGLTYIILRNGWYIENYVPFYASAIERGVLLGAAKNGKFSAATRADFGAAAVAVLSSNTDAQSVVYELGGDESYTLSELAAELSSASGKQVTYVDKPREELEEIYKSIGLPAEVAGTIAQSEEAATRGDLYDDTQQLSILLGRKTQSWKDIVRAEVSKLQ